MNYKGNFMAMALLALPLIAHSQPEVTATGTGRSIQIATENSWVSAHFQCGRKGYWADLDSIQTIKTDQSTYKIAGGRMRITQYHRTISTSCQSEYQRFPSDRQPKN